jgi:hypothetical protein
MQLIRQPKRTSMCGQAVVAMAAGVSLEAGIEAVGHGASTGTKEIVAALRKLGVPCADRLRRMSRKRPVLPLRALVAIHRPPIAGKRVERNHWLLWWDGVMKDPDGSWPNGYDEWHFTSYLELYPAAIEQGADTDGVSRLNAPSGETGLTALAIHNG